MTNFTKSLPVRVGKIIAIFSISLVACYTVLLTMLFAWGSAKATHGVLLYESARFLDAYSKDPSTPLPQSQTLQGYIGLNTIPQSIMKAFPPENWDTLYKTQEGIMYVPKRYPNGDGHLHLQVSDLPGREEKFYLYYEIVVPDSVEEHIKNKFRVLALAGAIMVTLMLLVFYRVIQRALMPIGSLSEWVKRNHDREILEALPADIRDDEIGQLARTLHQSLQHIHEQNSRERQFLRNASHELRTPIAIIRNTMDVLDHIRKQPTINQNKERDLLLRIRRASDTMKAVTEAILWLAHPKKSSSSPSRSSIELNTLIKELIEENSNLLQNKSVEVECQLDGLAPLQIEEALIYITLDNLIRNAFQHCMQGEILIDSPIPNTIRITNPSPHYDHCNASKEDIEFCVDTGGFGLGLSLVKKIAETQQWEFNFTVDEHKAVALLSF